MKSDYSSLDESARLASLLGAKVLNEDYNFEADNILNLCKILFGYPFGVVCFLDDENEHRVSFYGTAKKKIERNMSVAAEIIQSPNGWIAANSSNAPETQKHIIDLLANEHDDINYVIGSVIKASDGARIGAIYLGDTAEHGSGEKNLEIIQHLGSVIEDQIALNSLLLTDNFLGLPNRRGLYFISNYLLAHASRQGEPVGLIKVTINSEISDERQRKEFLREIANIISAQARGGDVLALFSANEFVLLLPDTDHQGVEQVMSKINTMIGGLSDPVYMDYIRQGRCKITIGGSCCEPHGDPFVLEEMIYGTDDDFFSESLLGVRNLTESDTSLLTGPVKIIRPGDQ